MSRAFGQYLTRRRVEGAGECPVCCRSLDGATTKELFRLVAAQPAEEVVTFVVHYACVSAAFYEARHSVDAWLSRQYEAWRFIT